MVLLIDHYDSFVFNLARSIRELGHGVKVVRQDAISIEEIKAFNPSHIVLSPGPSRPEQTGVSIEVVKRFCGEIPLFGVCLGHQVIGHVFGGEVLRAKQPMHGQASLLYHDAQGLFRSVPSPCWVGRYHSLIVNEVGLSEELKVVARSDEQEVMAFVSQRYRLAGVQFHPESVLTEGGHQLIQNFLDGTFV
jgi:para-aminobenzoate synthetase component II